MNPMLIGLDVNDYDLTNLAFEKTPSLILDCNLGVNLFDHIDKADDFSKVYIIEIEMLYKFLNALQNLPKYIEDLNIKLLVITNVKKLFDHGDEEETFYVFEQIWTLLKQHSKQIDILVGIKNKEQKIFAKKYCNSIQKIGTHTT